MEKDRLLEILDKYRKGVATQSEVQIVVRFLANRELNWDGAWLESSEVEKRDMQDAIYKSTLLEIDRESNGNVISMRRHKKAIWYAAASVAIFVCSAFIYISFNKGIFNFEPSYITKTASRGQRLTVKLEDGSIVKLNSESSITFPETFKGLNSREIQLTGEAFFDVARDEKKPFHIISGKLLTTVLGTSFNIKAYAERSSIDVTVVTGSVNVKLEAESVGGKRQKELILSPGELGTLDLTSDVLSKSKTTIEKQIAWSKDVLYFPNITFEEVAKELEKWYDIDLVFQNDIINDCKIQGKFKSDSFKNILKNLQFFIDFEYEITEQRKILVKGIKCPN